MERAMTSALAHAAGVAAPVPPASDPETVCRTLTETARLLRVHRATVHRLIVAGELKSFRIGSRRLITEAELRRFIGVQIADEEKRKCVAGSGDGGVEPRRS